MNQLGHFKRQDLLGLVDLLSFQRSQSAHFIHRQESQHPQTFFYISITDVSPVLIKFIRSRLVSIQPQCALLGLAHLLAFRVGQQRKCHAVHFLARLLASQIYAAYDVGPLVVSTKLDLHIEIPRHDHEVVALHQHVVQFKHRKPAFAIHPLLEAFCTKHGVHIEAGSDLTNEINVIQRQQPSRIVDRDRLARLRLFVFVTRFKHAIVALIFPVFIEIQEAIKQLLERFTITLNRLSCHHLTHICPSRRIAYKTGTASQQHDRRMTKLLHVHHDDHLHEVAYVKTVRGRVKANVKFHFLILQKLPDLFLVRGLFDKSPFLQHIINIGVLAHAVRYKIVFHSSSILQKLLFCAVKSISCIAQTRYDICVFVELLILCSNEDIYIRMSLLQRFDTFRSSDQAHENDLLAASCLDEINGSRSTSASCQHRVNDKDLSLVNIVWQFAIVFYRFVSFRISVKTNMADLSIRHQSQHAVHHTQSRSKDRNDGNVFALQHVYLSVADRSRDLHLFQRQLSRSFITHQHGNLSNQLSEVLDARILLTDHSSLVLDQRMIEYIYITHN